MTVSLCTGIYVFITCILPLTSGFTKPLALWPLGNETLANEVIIGGTTSSQNLQPGLTFYSSLLHPNLSYVPVFLDGINPIDLEIPTTIPLLPNSEFSLYVFMWTKNTIANLFHFKTTNPTPSGITEFHISLSNLHLDCNIKLYDGLEDNSFVVTGKDWIIQKVWFRIGIGVDKSNANMIFKIFVDDDEALQLISPYGNLDLDLPGILRIGSSFEDSTLNLLGMVTCIQLHGNSNPGSVLDMQKTCNSWNETKFNLQTSTIETSLHTETITGIPQTSHSPTEQSSMVEASTTYDPVTTPSGYYYLIVTGYFIVVERDTSPQLSPLFNAIMTYSLSACASHCLQDHAMCFAFTTTISSQSYLCTLYGDVRDAPKQTIEGTNLYRIVSDHIITTFSI